MNPPDERTAEGRASADVERLLTYASVRSGGLVGVPAGRPSATHALWLCACSSDDDETPVWLIYESAEGSIGWCRVPDGTEVLDLVDAELYAGGHDHPGNVLAWLHGTLSLAAWEGGSVSGDRAVLDHLAKRVRHFEPY